MYACIYELRKNCRGTGGRGFEGSTRGPRGPKKLNSLNTLNTCTYINEHHRDPINVEYVAVIIAHFGVTAQLIPNTLLVYQPTNEKHHS